MRLEEPLPNSLYDKSGRLNTIFEFAPSQLRVRVLSIQGLQTLNQPGIRSSVTAFNRRANHGDGRPDVLPDLAVDRSPCCQNG